MVAVASLPGLSLALTACFIPESARWVAQQAAPAGSVEDAGLINEVSTEVPIPHSTYTHTHLTTSHHAATSRGRWTEWGQRG